MGFKPALVGILLAVVATQASAAGKAHAVAKMIGLDGRVTGTADFRATSHGVLIELEMRGLAPGPHAVMVHTTASCDPKSSFTSAGPDLSLDPKKLHGFLAQGGPRAGDLPNQFAGADGVLHASMFTSAFTLGNGKKSIFDRDGASLIVHARGDDYTTQPDGRAGARVACGTIIRTVAPGSRGRSRRSH
ncbi:MAG: superoxide dismutase family protein [Alphaproteobacteria bacterium]|nr:superoxide dismutase family protein [Alphaproteobacteria bacterium]